MSVLLLLVAAGCSAHQRAVAAFAPESFAQAAGESGDPDDPLVEVVRVDRRGVHHAEVPERFTDRGGRTLERPLAVRASDTLRIRTPDPEVRVRFLLRNTGLFARSGFRPIHAVSGTLRGRFPTEVRTLPDRTPLDGILVLPVRILEHPQNGWQLGENDLLMIEAVRPPRGDSAAETQRLLFLRRTPGIEFDFFAGVLATVPTRSEEGTTGVTPILAVGPTFGVRTARVAGPERALDVLELVASVGIGSTALTDVQDDEAFSVQLTGLFDSALVGGGLRLFQVLTVQGYFNLTSVLRDGAEAPGTVAVGVDAAKLTALFERVGLRLLQPHPLPDSLYEQPPDTP